MLEIKDLSKSYGKTEVLSNINLKLEEKKIYGLLGRNGVGKTTLLNIISNQIRSDSGEAKLYNQNIYENSKAVENICLVKESGIPSEEKVKKIFKAAGILYKNWDEDYKNHLVNEFNLNINKKYHKLSRGNQTIVGLIIGLASRAPLTIFDEPSLGLDAAYRYKFYNLLLKDFDINPTTIIISTHLIDEVTNLFEDVIILKDKQIFLQDEVSNLMKKGYYLNGRPEHIYNIIRNKKVINKEDFGSSSIIALFDELSEDEKISLGHNNVDISNIPLQKLFIHLTETNSVNNKDSNYLLSDQPRSENKTKGES